MIARALSSRLGRTRVSHPSICIENIRVSDEYGAEHRGRWTGLVDTGATRSVVPLSVCHDLALYSVGWRTPVCAETQVLDSPTPVYSVRLLVEGLAPKAMQVFGMDRDTILIGLDFLQGLVLAADTEKQVAFLGPVPAWKRWLLRAFLRIC